MKIQLLKLGPTYKTVPRYIFMQGYNILAFYIPIGATAWKLRYTIRVF
jgi:hypothetical protein